MKKRIVSLIALISYCLCLLFFPLSIPTRRVFASTETYACIRTDTAYFYSTKNENNGLFLLPQTYFVKVLAKDTDYCHIEYLYDSPYTKKLTGYAKSSDLTFVEFTPNTPYLYHVFDVRYTVDGGVSDDNSFLDQITVTCAYYGDYKIGSKTYCYVLRGDSFGYIPKPDNLSFAPNTEYADYLAQPQEDNTSIQTESTQEGMSAAQIAILITLCLLVPLLAALILKTSKKNSYDFDEKDD